MENDLLEMKKFLGMNEGDQIISEFVPPGIEEYSTMYLLLKANWNKVSPHINIEDMINVGYIEITIMLVWLCDWSDCSYDTWMSVMNDLTSKRSWDTPLLEQVQNMMDDGE